MTQPETPPANETQKEVYGWRMQNAFHSYCAKGQCHRLRSDTPVDVSRDFVACPWEMQLIRTDMTMHDIVSSET